MTHIHSAKAIADFNQLALKNLIRVVIESERQFRIILVSCPPSGLRQEIIKKLQAQCTLPVREITLHPATIDLFSTIQDFLEAQYYDQYLGALLIAGLDSLIALEDLLRSANAIEYKFSQNFAFPLILWVDEEIISALRWCAPDLRLWATNTINFELPNPQFTIRETEIDSLKDIALPYIRKSVRTSDQTTTNLGLPRTNSPRVKSGKRNDMIAMLNTDHGVPEVVIMEPTSFTEVPSYIDILRARKSVILNLARISAEEAQRAVDFLAGVTYALDGNQKRVGNSVFLFTPSCVVLSTSLNERQSLSA